METPITPSDEGLGAEEVEEELDDEDEEEDERVPRSGYRQMMPIERFR